MSTVQASDHEGGVRVLTLDRPPANAIDDGLLRDLQRVLAAAAEDADVRAVVLTGAGAFFSGGLDLNTHRSPVEAREFRTLFRDAFCDLFSFPKPTIAYLAGHAIAGGVILVLACDYRLGAAGDYKIGLNEVAIGASYPRVALEIVRTRLTHREASELMLGAALYRASQAVRLGIVDELLEPDDAFATVLRRAARQGSHPPAAYAHTKAALLGTALDRINAETEAESEAMARIWDLPESREARARQRALLRRA